MKTRNLHTIGSPSADRPTFHMLDEGRLEVGDVLLENSPTITSSAIRFFDRGAFSHALIYMGDDQVVEAVQRGVVFLSTRRIVTRDSSRWLHMRPATPLTPFQQQGLEYAVRAQAFRRYSGVGAVGTKLKALRGRDPLRLFCSQLVALAYRMIGVEVVPGVEPEAVTPNMLCGSTSVLRPVSGLPFKVMPIASDVDLAAALKLENREEAVQGLEIDENRRIEQEVIAAVAKRFCDGAAFADGRARPIGNLSDALLHIQLMKREPARGISARLDDLLRTGGYFDLLRRTLDKSHVPTWGLTMAKLWYSGRHAEAMQWIEECHQFSLVLRRTSARLRREAYGIDAVLAARLVVFRSFRDNYLKMAVLMDDHCDEVDRFKAIKDMTWPPDDWVAA